ncbi:MAG: hypothetical protein J0H44_27035 [Alphaproteobacteria bacterium]|nr:hypothetical protein [Alphaproteobacteria bacterium]
MENLSPEIWTAVEYESRRSDDERSNSPPRSGEVLGEIGLLLLVHAVVVLLVVWALHAFGVH